MAADFALHSPNTSTGAAATAIAVFFSGANFYGTADAYYPPNESANFPHDGSVPPGLQQLPRPQFIVSAGMRWGTSSPRDASATAHWKDATPVDGSVAAAWRDAPAGQDTGLAMPWIQSVAQRAITAVPYTAPPASAADIELARGWITTPRTNVTADFNGSGVAYMPHVGTADFLVFQSEATAIAIDWEGESEIDERSRAVDHVVSAPWGRGVATDRTLSVPWEQSPTVDRAIRALWGDGDRRDARLAIPWAPGDRVDRALAMPWGAGQQLDNTLNAPFADAVATDREVALPWGKGEPMDENPTLPWEIDDPEPGDGLPDTVPVQETYTVNSNCDVVRLPERTVINVLGASASIVMSDFTYSAEIIPADKAGMDLLNPSGGLKEAEIDINGKKYRVIVERWRRRAIFDDQQGKRVAWVAQCRGITALLDAPYAQISSKLTTASATASQLAAAEVSGTGFSTTWSAVDWTLAAGEFSYQELTPARVLQRIAATPGAFVLPAANAKSVEIKSRLQHNPEDWASETPDAVIPQSIVVDIDDDWEPRQAYNGVQISGGTQGLKGTIKKQGTAGDIKMPDIVDRLIVDSTVCQERGRVELYDSGNRALVRRQIPILEGLGVREPGELLQNDDDDGTWFGLVKSVSVNGRWTNNGLACWQNITQDRRDL